MVDKTRAFLRRAKALAAEKGTFRNEGSAGHGFARGLAQMGSFGTARPTAEFPKANRNALRGDWERLGKDMTRAIDKVRGRDKAAR